MKKISLFIISVVLLMIGACNSGGEATKKDAKGKTCEDSSGLKLAVQAWTFHDTSFCTAIDMAKQAGVKYIEAYRGQQIGGGVEGNTHYTMDDETLSFIQDTLEKAGIKMVAYGVASGKDSAEWVQLFSFAKKMGIEVLTSEPNLEHMDLIEKLAVENDIKVAIHNHAVHKDKPEYIFWNPDSVMKIVKNRNPEYIGACADNGHWARSGIKAVDAYKALEGRVISLHLKDMESFDDLEAKTIPFGEGVNELIPMMKELKRQGFKGVVTIEYENKLGENLEDVKKCVDYFNKNLKKV
jgi:sugar phosphate isomerase/epimerase